MLLEHQRAALILNEMNKNQSFTCAIVFPLPLRRQLKRLSMPYEQQSKLKSFFLRWFCYEEKENLHLAVSCYMDSLLCFLTPNSMRCVCVTDDSNRIQFFIFVLRDNSIQTQFISNKLVIQLNSSIPFLWRDSIQLNSKLGNQIWIDLRVWIDLYRSAQGPFYL